MHNAHTYTHTCMYRYLEELEEDQIKLALAISTSMEADGGAAPVYGGEQLTEAVQGKGKKRQKRYTCTYSVLDVEN